ncbi:MAG: 4-(cytidine 5'-diphospho)-2-C-methyl-D-erythritol kinase, partial [Planctomycetes bacterium]|nr:4-(cytidine 5'-diphospho)-2-C-methyl-D-erythritol kinase [Planctomycetota bacterium]
GLGGASTDAAAALVAANLGWRLGWSRAELAGIAAELGSDIPFFLGSGAALCRGRGERIEPVSLPASLPLVVVRPPEGLSTAQVYGRCRPAEDRAQAEPLVAALQRGRLDVAARHMFNRLQAAAEQLTPWVGRLRSAFSRLDCLGHQMSGSGTSYFGICRHARHARRVAARLRSERLGFVAVASVIATRHHTP